MKAFFAGVWRWFLFGDAARAEALDLNLISIREDLRRARERAADQLVEMRAALKRAQNETARFRAMMRDRDRMRENAKHVRPSVHIVRRKRVTRSTQQGIVPRAAQEEKR